VFAEEHGKTTMTLRIKYPSKEARDAALESGMKAGLSLNFQHLDSYLGSATSFVADPLTQEIVMTRVFDAPRAMVFKAFTEAKAIEQWWGPRWLTNTVERMEARQGGVWRIVQRDVNGREYAFHGVFHESCGPERLVRTFEYEGTPGKVVLETVAFERLGDRTRVTTQSVFQSVADRDGMMTSGAELGARESFERLAELLAGQLV